MHFLCVFGEEDSEQHVRAGLWSLVCCIVPCAFTGAQKIEFTWMILSGVVLLRCCFILLTSGLSFINRVALKYFFEVNFTRV